MSRIRTIERNHPTPLKEQLRNWVTQQIQAGDIRAGDRIPSINELSGRFQICRETVRRSLDTLADRGVLIPEQGKGYFVAKRERQVVRVCILGKLDGVYSRPVYRGLTQVLGRDAVILFVDIQSSLSLAGVIETLAYHHAVDRVLVTPPRGRETEVEKCLEPFRRYFKIAWIDRAPPGTKDATFLCDYRRCVELALEAFHERSIERMFYFSRNSEDRSVFSTMRAAFRKKSRHAVIKTWREIAAACRHGKPIGVLAETDTEAVHLQSALLQAGVHIPREVMLISCDNSELTNEVLPAIAAIDPRFQQLGEEAGRWIQKHFEGATQFVAQPVFVPKTSCP